MAVLFADDFTGSDNTPIDGRTLPVGGGTWTALLGSTAEIWSNTYQEQGVGGVGYGNYMDPATLTCTASLDLLFPGSGFFDAGLYFRLLNGTNFWILIAEQGGGNGFLQLYEINGGGFSLRDSYNSGAAFHSTTKSIAVELSGDDITGYLDGVARVSYNSSFLNTEALLGIRNYVDFGGGFAMVPMDNFSVDGTPPAGGGQPMMRRWGGRSGPVPGIGQSSGGGKAWG